MFIILTITILFMVPQAVQAYIDPGTGSYLLQIIAVVVVSSLFALKTGWQKAGGLAKWIFKRGKK